MASRSAGGSHGIHLSKQAGEGKLTAARGSIEVLVLWVGEHRDGELALNS